MTRDWYFDVSGVADDYHSKDVYFCISLFFFFVLSDSFSGNRILKLYNCPHSQTILETFKAASLPAVGQYKLLKKKKSKAKEIQYKIY